MHSARAKNSFFVSGVPHEGTVSKLENNGNGSEQSVETIAADLDSVQNLNRFLEMVGIFHALDCIGVG
jgi:hypothetical protein